jgi:glutamate-1-semialdehyde 2,1-aminomutase
MEAPGTGIDRDRLRKVLEAERERFSQLHPKSRELYAHARESLLAGVPMSWMSKWAGGHPVYAAEAQGATIRDVDGHEYVDLCLGDTGAMAGHSPRLTVAAVEERLATRGGAAMMLPTEDAAWVGAELGRRFRVPLWSFTLSATDANRFAIRLCRQITKRQKILVFNWCYHGSVDESFITIGGEGPRAREGNVGPPVDPSVTTRVCEFNDLDALRAELAHGDVACVLTEPALTNIGIVLPEPGFLEGVRELTRESGALLIIDETHTASAGPGGCTAAWDLDPDLVTLGKWLGGGVPVGAYGVSAEVANRIESDPDADYVDTGGVGGTLAGNALSMAAARGTMGEVLTPGSFEHMEGLCRQFVADCERAIGQHALPWAVVQLGARAEYMFTPAPPRDGAESAASSDPELEDFLHLRLLNEGVLLTPFHNMALMCPATTAEDVRRHTDAFNGALEDLVGSESTLAPAARTNEDAVRDQYAAVNEGDWDRAMSHYTDDVELHVPAGGIRGGIFRGRDAVGNWFGEWMRTFDRGLHFEIVELREDPDGSISVAAEHVARGRLSGVEVRDVVRWRYEFRDGRIVRVEGLGGPGAAQ